MECTRSLVIRFTRKGNAKGMITVDLHDSSSVRHDIGVQHIPVSPDVRVGLVFCSRPERGHVCTTMVT